MCLFLLYLLQKDAEHPSQVCRDSGILDEQDLDEPANERAGERKKSARAEYTIPLRRLS